MLLDRAPSAIRTAITRAPADGVREHAVQADGGKRQRHRREYDRQARGRAVIRDQARQVIVDPCGVDVRS
jgi:hypothetical protein